MKLSQFKFNLPKELIAEYPSKNRDESKLMVVHRDTGEIEHKTFKDILDYFDEDDLFVFNDTKVFPARLLGIKEKTNAKIEVFLLREINENTRLWDILVEPARKIRIGNKLYFGENNELTAEVIDNTTSRGRTLRFLFDGSNEEFHKVLKQLGKTPLPDDILRLRDLTKEDNERYQTIYAANEGAVVAPTAGFHFSRELLKRMEIKGINRAFVTLHCGLGNFRQIEVEDLSKHKMDSEEMILNEETAALINNTKKDNKKVCIVGTTTMKAVESAATINGKVKVFSGWTNKFIIPDYEFQIADAMITNFHKPLSSMLIMACSFGGYDLIMKAYQEAIENNYKFLTYGDAMLII
ncbi:MAG: tRNA preQ1(34) S-adenosylmethionine ribosyltransferase-isomerase QueA [Bacteroidales bacterium]|nr:tRNA preQ1(34) S-adenosylmethionine ribosyltransferase-isomerase QueA [Bacteroidales bacterium]MDY6394360.1 tRNA preQ1(34) S-adenosylmethionine ribosyltransferase-isomerase QueA [Bacteroidales bacterium]